MNPEVTVVIPTRDRAAYLHRAVESVGRQRDVELEIVVVDDGSGPLDARQIARLSRPGLRVLRHETPRGPSAARNAGIDAARSGWVAFHDDDDFWAPEKLRSQLDECARTGARWVWSAAAHVDRTHRLLYIEAAPSPAEVRQKISSGTLIPAGTSNVIAQRALLLELERFDERIFHLQDWDMWFRLAIADGGCAVDAVHVAYVQHDEMLSHRGSSTLHLDIAIMEAKIQESGWSPTDHDTAHEILKWYAEVHVGSGRWRAAARAYFTVGIRSRRPSFVALGLGALGGRRGYELVGRALARRRGMALPEPEALAGDTAWIADVPTVLAGGGHPRSPDH